MAAMTLDAHSDPFPEDLDAVADAFDRAVRTGVWVSCGTQAPDPTGDCRRKAPDLRKTCADGGFRGGSGGI